MPGPYFEMYLSHLVLDQTPNGDDIHSEITLAPRAGQGNGQTLAKVDVTVIPQGGTERLVETLTNPGNGATPLSDYSTNTPSANYQFNARGYTKPKGGQLKQVTVDTLLIARPTGEKASAFSGQAVETNKTKFQPMLRGQAENTNATNKLSLQFQVQNQTTGKWDNFTAAVDVDVVSTLVETRVDTLDKATYTKLDDQGKTIVVAQAILTDAVTQKQVDQTQKNIDYEARTYATTPGTPMGTMPFQGGTIFFTPESQTTDTYFEYQWNTFEFGQFAGGWDVQPTGPGTLAIQVSWFNTATQEWELLYEDDNVGTQFMFLVQKTAQQCFNDTYQLKAILAGATTIEAQQTFTPVYLYPNVINDIVDAPDPT